VIQIFAPCALRSVVSASVLTMSWVRRSVGLRAPVLFVPSSSE
jgi:hypothetical protein